MRTELVPLGLPGEHPGLRDHRGAELTSRNRRLAFAFAIAAVSDALSFALAFAPPVQWVADAGTALLLFAVLGWQWVLLPGLIVEAIPGLAVFPFWVLVVGAVATWGRVRPSVDKSLLRAKRETPPNP